MSAGIIQALAGWKGYAAAVVVAGGLAGMATWTAQGWRWDADVASRERDAAQQLADATQLARKTEQARWAAREGVIDDAKEQAAAATADADSARAAADKLRGQVAVLQRRARDTAAAGGRPGEPGTDTIGLLAQLYDRMEQDGRAVSGYADQLKIAGLACERISDSLQ
jgi:hypothetical protein